MGAMSGLRRALNLKRFGSAGQLWHIGPKADASRVATEMERRLYQQDLARQPVEMEVFGTNAIKIVVRSFLHAEGLALADHTPRWAGRLVLVVQSNQKNRSNLKDRSPGCWLLELGERRGLQLRVRASQCLPPACREEVRVARETNIGKLAGAVAQRVREDGVAVVRGAGAVALKHQLRAVAIASGYLADRNELDGQDLVALPRCEDLQDSEGQKWTEYALTVYRLPISDF